MVADAWLYSLYPAFACVCCAFLFYKAYRTGAGTAYLNIFLSLALINLCQAVGHITLGVHALLTQYIADVYLIITYFLFTYFMQLALSLGEKHHGKWENLLYIPPIALTVFHLCGLMVGSYRIQDNAILHNDGTFSIAFDAFILIASTVTIVTFIINSKRIKKDYLLASRNIVALVSFIPFVLAAILLIILSNTEYVVPVIFVVPSVSLYLTVVFYVISKLDFSMGLGLFYIRLKLAWKVLKTYKTQQDIKNFYKSFEREIIVEKLRENEHHIKTTAEKLQINHTTLRGKIKEYNISS